MFGSFTVSTKSTVVMTNRVYMKVGDALAKIVGYLGVI